MCIQMIGSTLFTQIVDASDPNKPLHSPNRPHSIYSFAIREDVCNLKCVKCDFTCTVCLVLSVTPRPDVQQPAAILIER